MPPKAHEDYLSTWARQLKIPILSIDYGKAPEFPYPYALEQCFDVYRTLVETNGSCIGLEGWYKSSSVNSSAPSANATFVHNNMKKVKKKPIKIVIVGDSAGGNLATAVTLKIIETKSELNLNVPCGLINIYACLSFDITCWYAFVISCIFLHTNYC